MYAESFRGYFCSQAIRAVIGSQPLATDRRNPPRDKDCHKLNNNSLEVFTLPLYQYFARKLEFLLLEALNLFLILPNVILPVSPPNQNHR